MRAKLNSSILWLVAMFGLGMCLTTLPACNTVEGAGEDVEELGEGVQDVADDSNPYDDD
jgi:predicted small secreted protein